MESKNFKVTFCIVCMNRLHHLQQTLVRNINSNLDYENLEFLLLDYNSTDGLEQFIQLNMQSHLESGRLVYYKTLTPVYFNRGHSRNLSFNLASGDLICNLDADNFTGGGFASYINKAFQEDQNIFLTTISNDAVKKRKDVLGRICLKKSDFHRICGYDEKMSNYGFEDYDLVNRLEMTGLKRVLIAGDESFFQVISHSHKERISNEYMINNIERVLVSYLTPSSTEFVLLLHNNQYLNFTLIDNESYKYERLSELAQLQLKYRLTFFDSSFDTGSWKTEKDDILLGEELRLTSDLHAIGFKFINEATGLKYYRIVKSEMIEKIIMTFSQISNRILMEENVLKQSIIVNAGGYGRGEVYKNFNYKTPIIIS